MAAKQDIAGLHLDKILYYSDKESEHGYYKAIISSGLETPYSHVQTISFHAPSGGARHQIQVKL